MREGTMSPSESDPRGALTPSFPAPGVLVELVYGRPAPAAGAAATAAALHHGGLLLLAVARQGLADAVEVRALLATAVAPGVG